MSLKDRFVDGVSSLFDKVGDGDSLSGVDPASLERELAARVKARKEAGEPKPTDNKRATIAGAGSNAREKRQALADKRVKHIHARRERDAAKKKKEQDEAYRRMAEEARRAPPPRSSTRSSSGRTSSGPRRSSSQQRRRAPIFQQDDLAAHYKTLDVEYGADMSTVKSAYRKLMRKYHPDLHQDPKKKKAATELTVKLTTAYNAIDAHQNGKK